MLFSSIPFLYYFLPAVILAYFLVSWAVEGLFRAGGKAAFGKKAGLFTKNLMLFTFVSDGFNASGNRCVNNQQQAD